MAKIRAFIGSTHSVFSFGSSRPAASSSSQSFIWWAMSKRSYCELNLPFPP